MTNTSESESPRMKKIQLGKMGTDYFSVAQMPIHQPAKRGMTIKGECNKMEGAGKAIPCRLESIKMLNNILGMNAESGGK